MIRELEKVLVNDITELQKNDIDTCLVVDVMIVMRLLKWNGCKNFRDLAENFCKFVCNQKCKQQTKRIDFVFDSYEEKSLKSSEHIRRCKSDVIVYNNITHNTPLPKQEQKFWGSSQNKILLQKYLRDFIRYDTTFFCGLELVFSTINESPSMSINVDLQNLKYDNIEEADVKIIVHIDAAIKQGYTNCYIISSDTDVIVLILYFLKTFKENGLQVCTF